MAGTMSRERQPEQTIVIGLTADELDFLMSACTSTAEDYAASGSDVSESYPGYTEHLMRKLRAARADLRRKSK